MTLVPSGRSVATLAPQAPTPSPDSDNPVSGSAGSGNPVASLTITSNIKANERALELAMAAVRTAAENRAVNIVLLDLRKLTPVFDYFVIATGSSRRQLHAISEEIDNVLQKELGDKRLGIEGYEESRWIVLDYGNLVVQLFDDETRAYYDLEGLWGEAERIDVTDIVVKATGR